MVNRCRTSPTLRAMKRVVSQKERPKVVGMRLMRDQMREGEGDEGEAGLGEGERVLGANGRGLGVVDARRSRSGCRDERRSGRRGVGRA